jgi:hypothetical protein
MVFLPGKNQFNKINDDFSNFIINDANLSFAKEEVLNRSVKEEPVSEPENSNDDVGLELKLSSNDDGNEVSKQEDDDKEEKPKRKKRGRKPKYK